MIRHLVFCLNFSGKKKSRREKLFHVFLNYFLEKFLKDEKCLPKLTRGQGHKRIVNYGGRKVGVSPTKAIK